MGAITDQVVFEATEITDEILEYLHVREPLKPEEIPESAPLAAMLKCYTDKIYVSNAVECNQLEVFAYGVKKVGVPIEDWSECKVVIPIYGLVAEHDNMCMMEYLCNEYPVHNFAYAEVFTHGSARMNEYLRLRGFPPGLLFVMISINKMNNVEEKALELKAEGLIPTSEDISLLIANEKFDYVKFLIENIGTSDKDSRAVQSAVLENNLELVHWLIEKGFGRDNVLNIALKHKPKLLNDLLGCEFAFDENSYKYVLDNFPLLQHCFALGLKFDKDTINFALGSPGVSLESMKWMIDNGCPTDDIDVDAIFATVSHDNGEKFKFLVEKKIPFNKDIGYAFARLNMPDLLQFMVDKKVDFNREMIDIIAAKNGHLDVLKVVVENNFPMDERVLMAAVLEGHHDCANYLIRNKAPAGPFEEVTEKMRDLLPNNLDS